ncbi:uncharacterized protein LOC118435057 [Folsomia candida]|uniref:uncharacterized protein LOC118435057 n=1 Tax=Folsomia candida TaxID=158441 RepID=UPI001604DEB9|nr:uncharacterized protein LOC118435057 [Folsomia candida]
MVHYFFWSLPILCFVFVAIASLAKETNALPFSTTNYDLQTKTELLENHPRVKRSPFIMAFQVTKPPGMFQMSLRRPYIMNMMSNLTRSLFSSSLTDMIRRGFGSLVSSSNATVVEGIRSRQEDLELFDK